MDLALVSNVRNLGLIVSKDTRLNLGSHSVGEVEVFISRLVLTLHAIMQTLQSMQQVIHQHSAIRVCIGAGLLGIDLSHLMASPVGVLIS